jgi:hypothetical protein
MAGLKRFEAEIWIVGRGGNPCHAIRLWEGRCGHSVTFTLLNIQKIILCVIRYADMKGGNYNGYVGSLLFYQEKYEKEDVVPTLCDPICSTETMDRSKTIKKSFLPEMHLVHYKKWQDLTYACSDPICRLLVARPVTCVTMLHSLDIFEPFTRALFAQVLTWSILCSTAYGGVVCVAIKRLNTMIVHIFTV